MLICVNFLFVLCKFCGQITKIILYKSFFLPLLSLDIVLDVHVVDLALFSPYPSKKLVEVPFQHPVEEISTLLYEYAWLPVRLYIYSF